MTAFTSDTEVLDTVLQDAKTVESKGKVKNLPIEVCCVRDNPREDHNIEPIVNSMLRHGYLLNQPIVVVEDGEQFLVVRGNRRYLAVCWIREHDPETFAQLFPKGTIPAIVHKKCSAQETALLRMDFDSSAERAPLNAWEMFLAVRCLVKAGYLTETGIAEKLGMFVDDQPARSWAQTRVRLARLPVDIQNMFRTCFLKTKENTLRIGDIAALAKMYRAKPDSSQFAELVQERANRKSKDATDPAVKIKFALTPKDVRDRMNSFDSEIMRRFLSAMISDVDDLTTIDADLCGMATRLKLLDVIEASYPEIAEAVRDTVFAAEQSHPTACEAIDDATFASGA